MTKLHLSEAFPGERVTEEIYPKLLEWLGSPSITVTLIPGRCGSTFLADIVRGTGICGTGDETFNEIPRDAWIKTAPQLLWAFAQALKRAKLGGVSWFQIAPHRFDALSDVIDSSILRQWRYTTLLRRDILAQAISYVYATESGVWHSSQHGQDSNINITVGAAVALVVEWVQAITEAETAIDHIIHHFASAPPLAQFYEDIVASPYEELGRFLRFNGVRYNPADIAMGETSLKLRKSGAMALYDECCTRHPWVEKLVQTRKTVKAPRPRLCVSNPIFLSETALEWLS
jgi:hypothetical protein